MSERDGKYDDSSRGLFDAHLSLVRKIAYGVAKGLPNSVQVDDLLQDGLLGLMDAVIRCNVEMSEQQVRSFAAQRIRGAVLDGLRSGDWGTRRVRREMRRVEIAVHQLGHQLARPPSDGEVAAALGLPLADYQRLLQDAHGYTLISLEDLECRTGGEDALACYACNNLDPLLVLERAAFQKAMAAALDALPAREKAVLADYYDGGRTMREIAAVLDVSEARVSQLHAQAIVRLRAVLLGEEEHARLLAPRRRAR